MSWHWLCLRTNARNTINCSILDIQTKSMRQNGSLVSVLGFAALILAQASSFPVRNRLTSSQPLKDELVAMRARNNSSPRFLSLMNSLLNLPIMALSGSGGTSTPRYLYHEYNKNTA